MVATAEFLLRAEISNLKYAYPYIRVFPYDFKVKHFPMGLLVNAKQTNKQTNPAKLAGGWNKQTKPKLFLLSNKKVN